jgi:transposase
MQAAKRLPELKVQILAECDMRGASVAKGAMAHGVNANRVHGRRKLERDRRQAAATAVQASALSVSDPPVLTGT